MKGFTKTQLQTIAVIAMVSDHAAWGFLPFFTVPAQVLHIIGRLTIPIMCFFIAEGFRHTHDLKKYIVRMLFFWVASALPFYCFFHEIYDYRQSILFDLLLGLVLLAALENNHLHRWQKGVIGVLLFAVSLLAGGWPILPMLYILIFYYKKEFAAMAKWFCGTTICFVCLLMLVIRLNQTLHFSSYDWVWYDKLYLFGFILALPLLWLYRGKRGSYPAGRYTFYLFYPLHLLVLYGLRLAVDNRLFYELYLGMQLFVMAATFFAVIKIILSRPSKAQASSVVFGIFALVYLFGFLLEITTTSFFAVFTAIKVQYFGEIFVFMGFTWFISEFCNFPLPKKVYVLEGLISLIFIALVCTTDSNHFFYRGMYMEYSGPFPRIALKYGPGFYLLVLYVAVICVFSLLLCIREYLQGTGIEKKRSLCMIASMICPWLPLLIRSAGLSGGYEVTSIGVLGSAVCIALALIRYGYFDSVQLASENALNHGKEGVMVISPNRRILYFNQIIRDLFPDIRLREDAYNLPYLKDIMEHNLTSLPLHNKMYEIRLEPLMESGYVQGYMMWAIDMTDHYKRLIAAENGAHTDSLTGLNNRSYFRFCLDDHIRLGGTGSMMMLDLDNFKCVNDTYGHGIGDMALLALSDTMKKVADNYHLTCRMGGDEFCLFVKDITEKEALAALAKDLIYSFRRALSKAGIANITSISLGIAMLDTPFLEDIVDEELELFDELYRRADRALYVAKNNGKNIYRFYSSL